MNIVISKHAGYNFYTVKNNKDLKITFTDFGASIYEIKYKNKVITYHEKDYKAFLNSSKFCGKTLGRVAGRIKDGILKIGNKTYQLEQNEKCHTLHGGKHCLSTKVFKLKTKEDKKYINLIFTYLSKHLEAGFPHDVNFTVTYKIYKNENKFDINYLAIPNGLTPISMSTHTYWRLTGNDILNHYLKVNGNEVTKLDNDLIMLGKIKSNSTYNFSHEKKIGKDILNAAKDNKRANGYDIGFIINKSNKPQIVLRNNHIKLLINADMNMAVIYTNCYPTKNVINGYGLDKKYGGVAIEPQLYSKDIKGKLFDKKHPYKHYIKFSLETY